MALSLHLANIPSQEKEIDKSGVHDPGWKSITGLCVYNIDAWCSHTVKVNGEFPTCTIFMVKLSATLSSPSLVAN